MSKEMRKYIDTFKKFNLNEGSGNCNGKDCRGWDKTKTNN